MLKFVRVSAQTLCPDIKENMWPFNHQKIIIGSEYDEALRKNLYGILKSLNATQTKSKQYVVGSQDILIEVFKVNKQKLKIITETHEGIVIKGPKDLVNLIEKNLHNEKN